MIRQSRPAHLHCTPVIRYPASKLYQKFQHTWELENTGTWTWRGRRMYFLNHDSVRLKADSVHIDISETSPHRKMKVTVNMDPRELEIRSTCRWIMVDSEGNNCFPGSDMFSFVVDVEFQME